MISVVSSKNIKKALLGFVFCIIICNDASTHSMIEDNTPQGNCLQICTLSFVLVTLSSFLVSCPPHAQRAPPPMSKEHPPARANMHIGQSAEENKFVCLETWKSCMYVVYRICNIYTHKWQQDSTCFPQGRPNRISRGVREKIWVLSVQVRPEARPNS